MYPAQGIPPQFWPLLVTQGVCNIAAKQSIISLICMAVANHSRAPMQTRIDVPLDPSPFVGQALTSSKLSAQFYMAEQQDVLSFWTGFCCSIWRLATRGARCPRPPGILGRALMWPTCQPSPPQPSWQKKSSASATTSSPRPCPSR